MKRLGLAAFTLLMVGGLGVLTWAAWPISVDQDSPDPALVQLNQTTQTGVAFKEGYFESNGRTLHYVEAGDGQAIAFIHGFPSFWYSFAPQLQALATQYRVISVDGLGAGRSDAPSDIDAYRLKAMSEHIVALLDHLGEDSFHLVGHDWGSALALGIAQSEPHRIISVTGLSAPSLNAILHGLENDPEARETAAYVEQFKSANAPLLAVLGVSDRIYDGAYRPLVEDGKLTPEEGQLFRNATSDPKRINTHINWYRANLPHPDDVQDADYWPSKDARVTVPALYIWGADDPIYNDVAIKRLLDLSDDAQLITLPNTKHWPHVREAKTVNRVIADHLAKATANAKDQSSSGEDQSSNE
ncbi:MAG: alpha/beta hydrolase [Pseudomonadota bacterium]